MIVQKELLLPRFDRGFHLISSIIESTIQALVPKEGLLNLFLQHTSAGLSLNENADGTVLLDFESYFNMIVPENQSFTLHDYEGPDDMPAHIKSTLTGHSLTIPIVNHKLALGVWQGIYLCEFRNKAQRRKILITLYY